MQTFKYKDKRVKYYCMLVLSILSFSILGQLIMNYNPRLIFVYRISTVVNFIVLFSAITGLRERVIVKENEVLFIKLFGKKIRYHDIRKIRMTDNGDICFEVQYKNNKILSWPISFFESDNDIGMYRTMLASLIQAVNLANPAVPIDHGCVLDADGTSEHAARQAHKAQERRATLKGLGGWLGIISLELIILAFAALIEIAGDFAKLSTGNFTVLAGNFIIALLYGINLLLIIVALVHFFRKKMIFKKTFILFAIYTPIMNSVTLALNYVLAGKHFDPIVIFITILLPVMQNIVWIFAFKEYLNRSIRVKNTLVK